MWQQNRRLPAGAISSATLVIDDKQQIQQILPKGVTIKAFKKIAIG